MRIREEPQEQSLSEISLSEVSHESRNEERKEPPPLIDISIDDLVDLSSKIIVADDQMVNVELIKAHL